MKNNFYVLVLTVFCLMPINAENKFIFEDIKTVSDVEDVRNELIDRMTEILISGKLSEKRAKMLEDRITKISTKPLPTQEQIDWRLNNPIDISKILEQRGFKRDMRSKMLRKRLLEKR
jgi:hypothetical protein